MRPASGADDKRNRREEQRGKGDSQRTPRQGDEARADHPVPEVEVQNHDALRLTPSRLATTALSALWVDPGARSLPIA